MRGNEAYKGKGIKMREGDKGKGEGRGEVEGKRGEREAGR